MRKHFVAIIWKNVCESLDSHINCVQVHSDNVSSIFFKVLVSILIIKRVCFFSRRKNGKEKYNKVDVSFLCCAELYFFGIVELCVCVCSLFRCISIFLPISVFLCDAFSPALAVAAVSGDALAAAIGVFSV